MSLGADAFAALLVVELPVKTKCAGSGFQHMHGCSHAAPGASVGPEGLRVPGHIQAWGVSLL